MKTSSRASVHAICCAVALLVYGMPTVVLAAPAKIFVASYGNDANSGSPASPKRSFQAAHDAVAAGGGIVALDTAGYGALNIAKSVSVIVPPGINGFVTVPAGNDGITIQAGSTDAVSLRGLVIEGGGTGGSRKGITAASVGNLSIEDCTVRSFNTGILFNPSNSAKLYVYDTTARRCGIGIDVRTSGTLTNIATISGCRLEQNSVAGLEVFTPGGGNTVDVTAVDCIVSGNTN